jgi:hypothetical protein
LSRWLKALLASPILRMRRASLHSLGEFIRQGHGVFGEIAHATTEDDAPIGMIKTGCADSARASARPTNPFAVVARCGNTDSLRDGEGRASRREKLIAVNR